MRKPVARHLFMVLLVSSLLSIFLVACDDRDYDPCVLDDSCPASTTTISGKVIKVTAALPYPTVAGATVELEDGSISTTSGEDGSWSLEGVPLGVDPLIKITAPGDPPGFPVAYNSVPLSLGIDQYDLQVLDAGIYGFLVGMAGAAAADPEKVCLILGAVIGFARLEYPQITITLADATVTADNEAIHVWYLKGGFPDPNPPTDASGAFFMVVPDAAILPAIGLSATKPGTKELVASPQPTRPGSFMATGVIDPYFTPW
jgi:hypothetical protein